MGRFTRHLALGEKIVINGEEFELKPLSIENIADFFEAMKSMSGAAKASGKENIDPSDALKYMTKEGAEAIGRLIDATLKISLPDESAEERRQFGLKYMGELLNKIFEMNSAMVNPDAAERLKDKVKTLQNEQHK